MSDVKLEISLDGSQVAIICAPPRQELSIIQLRAIIEALQLATFKMMESKTLKKVA